MVYVCEDPNDALQRRMHEDMDTCAFTHFGMLEKTGAIESRAQPADGAALEPRAAFEPRATVAPPRVDVLAPEPHSIGLVHVVIAVAAVAAIAWYMHRKR